MRVHNMKRGFSKEVNDNKDKKKDKLGIIQGIFRVKSCFILINEANEMN